MEEHEQKTGIIKRAFSKILQTSFNLYSNYKRAITVLSVVLFIGIVIGTVGYFVNINGAKETVQEVVNNIVPEPPKTDFEFALFIFVNNLIVATLTMLFAWSTIFPIYTLLVNGVIIGFFGELLAERSGLPLSKFYLVLVPHGIIEIPAIMLSSTAGVKLFKGVYERNVELILEGLKIYALVVIGLLVAAFVEVYISVLLLT